MTSTTKAIAFVGALLIGAALVVKQSDCGAPKVERTIERGVH